jgi:hypothetical protein
MQEAVKFQNALWWIASIAVSVLCCSVLFILFASYLVEVKADVRDNNIRLNVIEQREDRILAEIEMIHKHDIMVAPAAAPTSAPSEGTSPPATPTEMTPAPSVVTPPATETPTTTMPAPMTPPTAPTSPVTVPTSPNEAK